MVKLLKELALLAAAAFTVIAVLALVIWGVSAVFFSDDSTWVEDQTARGTASPVIGAAQGGDDHVAAPGSGAAIASRSTPLPAPTQAAAAQPVPATSVDFSGYWRIIDTVTEGQGAGETYSFDVLLPQSGDRLGGGNAGIVMVGRVNGATAQVSYEQRNLGYSGTFTWTMGADGNASGRLTNSSPNSGASYLIRLP
jgi:hypothetical protein